MKSVVLSFLIIFTIFFISCGNSNVNTTLTPEKVDNPKDENDNPEKNQEDGRLFDGEPGMIVKLAALTETDPVGTSMSDDFDGDGIKNADEITTNAWVANYPKIEVYIAPPVTLKIAVEDSSHTTTTEIGTEISSSDVEYKREHSSDAVHNNEINLRTTQYQDSYNNSSNNSSSSEHSGSHSESESSKKSANLGIGGLFSAGGSGSSSSSESDSWSNKVSEAHSKTYGETKTHWKDVPFKNNTERNGWSVKSNSATKNAVNIRKELRTASEHTLEIKPNAGYVRAALYLTNDSVNMPVKLTNILCSLMFETPQGQLIPVQSFRLRNDDYSMFEIEVYGKETFGPYVIELNNLNTHEVKEAIEKGYNPKIFIIDYDMIHVKDSNYRNILSDKFTGDNLKIIEENSKGRTSGIRLIGPNLRKFYRVTAFEPKSTTGGVVIENQLGVNGADALSAGVSLKRALERLVYSGDRVEFANYIVDFSGMIPEMKIKGYSKPMFMVTAIKSVNGVKTIIPLVNKADNEPLKDANGEVIKYNGLEIYLTKPASGWTDEEAKKFKAWVVMNDSKFFGYTNDVYENGNTVDFTFTDQNGEQQKVPVVQGVNSTIWPGDHYDIVYMEMSEYLKMLESFGHNPLDTQEKLKFNTRWKRSDLGDNPFYPDTHSTYLGKAALGETIQFKIKLNWTKYLNPDFGDVTKVNGNGYYNDFSYDMLFSKQPDLKFLLDDAIDFEVSFASGGEYRHWLNLKPKRMPFFAMKGYYVDEDENYKNIDYLWDFLNQEFIVRIKLPSNSEIEAQTDIFDGGYFPGADDNGLVNVYLRTGLNTAYRENIWPLTDVKKFRGYLYRVPKENVTENDIQTYETKKVIIKDHVGKIETGDIINFYDSEISVNLQVQSVTENEKGEKVVILNTDISDEIKDGKHIYIDYGEDKEKLKPEISVNKNSIDWVDENTASHRFLSRDNSLLGFNDENIVTNWKGNNNLNNPVWNNWGDASDYDNFLSRSIRPFILTELEYNNNNFLRVDVLMNPSEFNIIEENENINYQISEVYDDKVLVVWQNGEKIKGQVYNIKTHEKIGNEVIIASSQPEVSDIKITTSDNWVFVTWKNFVDNNEPLFLLKGHFLRGQVFNLSDNSLNGNNIEIYRINEDSGAYIGNYHIASYNGEVFVLFSTYQSSLINESGALIDLPGALLLDRINQWSRFSGLSDIDFDLLLLNDKVLIALKMPSQNSIQINEYDKEAHSLKTYTISLNVSVLNVKLLKINNNKILVTWISSSSLVYPENDIIYGQIIDTNIEENYLIGSKLKLFGETRNGLMGETLNSTITNYHISYHNNKAFVIATVESDEYDDNYMPVNYVVGQEIDLNTGEKVGNQILIGRTSGNYYYEDSTPLVALGDNEAFAVWKESTTPEGEYNPDMTSTLKGRYLDLHKTFEHIEDGLNYFFKSPLIEREYEVEVKILK